MENLKKELQYVNTGNPAFALLNGINWETASEEDYVGCYYVNEKGEKSCAGAWQIKNQLPNGYVPIMGNDLTTSEKDGFDVGENVGIFYFDAETEAFYDVKFDTVVSYYQKTLTELKFAPFNLVRLRGLNLGAPVELIPNSASEVVFEWKADMPKTWDILTQGDRIKLRLTKKNVKDVHIQVIQGKGKITTNGFYTWYDFDSTDTIVNLIAVGTDVFTGDKSMKVLKILVNTEETNTPYYENQWFSVYKQGNGLYMKTLTTHGIFVHFKYDGKGITKHIASGHQSGVEVGKSVEVMYLKNKIGKTIKVDYYMVKGLDHWSTWSSPIHPENATFVIE